MCLAAAAAALLERSRSGCAFQMQACTANNQHADVVCTQTKDRAWRCTLCNNCCVPDRNAHLDLVSKCLCCVQHCLLFSVYAPQKSHMGLKGWPIVLLCLC